MSGSGSGLFTADFSSDFDSSLNLFDSVATADSYVVTAAGLRLADLAVSTEVYPRSSAFLTLTDTVGISDIYPASAVSLLDSVVGTEIYLTALASSAATPFTTDFTSDFGSGIATINVTLADNVVISESYPLIGDSANLFESAVSSDSLNGLRVTVANLVDSAAGSDALSLFSAVVTLADTVVSNDSLTLANAVAALPTDTLVTTDLYLSANTAYTRVLTDTATVSDSVVNLSRYAAFSDSTVAGESLASSFSTDYNPFTTDFSIDFGGGSSTPGSQTQNDTAVVDGVAVGLLIALGAVSDSVGSVDFYAYPVTATLNETTGSSDTVSVAASFSLSDLADSVASNDSFITTGALAGLTDATTSSDSFSGIVDKPRALADSAVTTEAYSPVWSLALVLNDSPSLTEFISTSLFINTKSLTDAIFSSEFYNLVIFVGTLPETPVSSSDVFSATSNAPVSVIEVVVAADSYTVASSAISLFDTAASATTFIGLTNSQPALSDTAGSSDTLSLPGLGLTVMVTESATLTDTIAVTSGGATVTGLVDIGTLSESLFAATVSLAITIAEATAISDAISVTALRLSMADSAVSSDVAGVADFSTSLSDSLVGSDTVSLQLDVPGILTDNAIALDGLAVSAASMLLADAILASESLGVAAGLLNPSLNDSAVSSDLYTGTKGFPAVLADILGDSDLWNPPSFGYLLGLSDTLSDQDQWLTQGVSTLSATTLMAIPTGGAVLLRFEGYFPLPLQPTTLTIERSVSGTAHWVTIYRGPPLGVFIDVGDSLPQTLDASVSYLWRASDNGGTVTLGPLMPAPSFFTSSPV